MIYKLERRNTGLAMPVSLFNFLVINEIDYTYNFEKGGIEVSKDDLQRIRINFKAGLELIPIKDAEIDKKPFKIENTKSKRRKLI